MKKSIVAAIGLFMGTALVPSMSSAEGNFQHVGTFDVMDGNGSSVAEIVDTTRNGKKLVYTDSTNGAIGLVDISDPSSPVGLGTVDVGGEPTSLVISDPWVLVGVNTSPDFDNPSGQLVVVNHSTGAIVATHDLGGQPDSLALAPNRKRAAIVIENERDEDENGGLIPQLPSGKLLVVNLKGAPKKWQIKEADLSPVAAAAFEGTDLEAEFVDINRRNEAVVSFQENNHLAVVNLINGKTKYHFSAGEVELQNVDTVEDDLITFDSTITKRAEPDAVAWIDTRYFATANEGDYEDALGIEGGARGFTIFDKKDGSVQYESGSSYEHWLASAGHYNEGRSENKGCEPESVEVGKFGKGKHKDNLLFVGSERCNVVGVYNVSSGTPEPLQLLPTGIGPEGLKAISRRNLFVASTETDEAATGIPTMINIYRYNTVKKKDPVPVADYPMIESGPDGNGLPIPWVALSGLAGDPTDADTLYAVSDAFLAAGFIYTIDVSEKPAEITRRLEVTGASQALDLEGIAVGPDGNFWLACEGDAGTLANLVLKVDATTGAVIDEYTLPVALEELATTPVARSNGFEGIAVTGVAGEEVVYVAIQRAWPSSPGGDTDKVNTKIGRYDVETGEWAFVHYPLEAETDGGWIGLSELTLLPDGFFAVIERDKGWGPTTGLNAGLKAIYRVDLAPADFRAYDDPAGLVTVNKLLFYDVLPELQENSIWTTEKLEGMAVAADANVYVVTDNDGIDGATGETVFLKLGNQLAQ